MSEKPAFDFKLITIATFVGIGAALLGTVSDVLLLFAPGANYLAADYVFLEGFSRERMATGHLLGVLVIPMLLAGLVPVYVGLEPAGKFWSRAAVVIGIYLAFPGVVYHGSVAFISEWVNAQAAGEVPADNYIKALEFYKLLSDPLAAALMVGFLAISVIFALLVAKGKTRFPKWQAALNPFSFYAIILLLYLTNTTFGDFLVVTGFNLSMALFYFFAWISLKKYQRKGKIEE